MQTEYVKNFCITPNLDVKLGKIQAELDVCENSLNEFMDRKRKTFPRFYFVAPDDLLFMLSNGNDPKLIVPLFNKN